MSVFQMSKASWSKGTFSSLLPSNTVTYNIDWSILYTSVSNSQAQ